MRNALIFLSFFLCLYAQAQLTVGQGTLSLYNSSVLKLDKLTLVPSATLTISNNRLEQSTSAVALNGSVNSINRVLTFSSPVVFTGMVRLFFDPNDLNGNIAENLKLSYKNASSWHSSVQGAVNIVDNYVDETLASKTFEALTASVAYIALPVKLVSFMAKWQPDESVLLQWQTAGEKDNSYFAIERSTNGQSFTPIARLVAAATPAGASYNFTDKQPPAGTLYYRLRQYDRDGQSYLLGVRMLRSSGSNRIAVYPNPVAGGSTTLEVKGVMVQPLHYSISNTAGQVVQNGRLVAGQQQIATGSLPAGTYLLQLSDGQAVRFLKQ